MPIYEYQCPQCQAIFEEWLSISESTDKAPCPQCKTEASRIISNTAFVLKGGGWYVTEYGNRKTSNNNSSATSTQPAAAESAAPAPSATSSSAQSTSGATQSASA